MSNIDWGPFFQTGYFYDDETKHERMATEGMTLRDYFAAKAMQGFLNEYVYDNSDVIADKAYTVADAMLKAREQ